jgi:hypothetical protein
MPASKPVDDPKMFPSRIQEDQDMEMKPVVMGPPPYSSPEGEFEGQRMVPLEDQTSGYEGALQAVSGDMKATEWVDKVKAASSADELNGLEEQYLASGKEYKTVDDAIEAKRSELKGN